MPKGGRKSRKDGFNDERKPEEAEARTPSSSDEEEKEGLPKNIVAEIAKMKKDNKGLVSIRVKKPNASFSKQDVENDFGHFGNIADIHFTDTFVYIRYKNKEEAEKAVTLMHDTYTIDVPHVSRGWNPKEPEEVSAKVAKLSPDTRGWYSIRVIKPNAEFKEKDVENNFGKYGEIADVHFTEKFIYVRYLSWKEAANAVRGLNDKFNLDIPHVSDAWKPQKSHSDKGPQIYIGNISHKASKEEVAELLERYTPREFKFYSINNKNFAFAYFESQRECKAAVSDLNGKVLRGTALLVRICRDRSRARYIAEDDYQSKKGHDRKKGLRGDFKTTSPFGQGIVELYVSNFGWNVTQAQIAELFQPHGQLSYVEVMPISQSSGECRKAYVGMYDAYEAKQAMHKLNQRSWNGLKLNVAYSTRNPVKSGQHHGGADSNQFGYSSNPVDRAYTLSNKLDIMLEDVLDKCDFCVKIHGLMSELQQAIREIKYQALRGDIMQGLSALNEIIDQLGTQQQQQTAHLPKQFSNSSGPPQQFPMNSSMNKPMNQQYQDKLEEFYANGASGVQNQFYGGGGMMAEGSQYMGGYGSQLFNNGAGLGGFGAAGRGQHGNRPSGLNRPGGSSYGRGRGRGNRFD